MKFTIPSEDLAAALQRIRPVIGNRTSIAVLGNVLLSADATGLLLTASNLEQRVSMLVPCEVTEEGSTTLPFSRLMLTASRMNGAVACKTDEKHVSVLSAAGASVRLHGLPPDEFPPADSITGTELSLPMADLQKWLGKAAPFMSVPAQAREVLESVLLDVDDSKLVLIATDGRRMLCVRTDRPADKIRVALPSNGVKALLGMDSDGDATLVASDSAIQIKGNAWTLQSKVVDLGYPNWKTFMPSGKPFEKEVAFSRDDALDALSTVGITMDDKAQKLIVDAQNGTVRFETETADIGKTSVELERKAKGGEFRFSVNPRFLADSIRVCDEPEVFIRAEDQFSALIITEANLTSITMPMRVVG